MMSHFIARGALIGLVAVALMVTTVPSHAVSVTQGAIPSAVTTAAPMATTSASVLVRKKARCRQSQMYQTGSKLRGRYIVTTRCQTLQAIREYEALGGDAASLAVAVCGLAAVVVSAVGTPVVGAISGAGCTVYVAAGSLFIKYQLTRAKAGKCLALLYQPGVFSGPVVSVKTCKFIEEGTAWT